MKSLLGQDQLKWNTKQVEGCYAGHQAYEFNGSTQDGEHLTSSQDAQRQPPNNFPSKASPEFHHEPESYGNETTDDYYIRNANDNVGGRENNGWVPSSGKGVDSMYTSGPINEPVSKHRSYGNGGGEPHLASGSSVTGDVYPSRTLQEGTVPSSVTGVARPTSRVNEPVDEVTPVSGSRKLRPGAGYANKQSYNIFTGE